MKRVRFYSIAILILVLLAACGQDESQDIAYTDIHIHFAPSAPHQNVTKVIVFISVHDGEAIERELDIDGRKATGAVAVPVGELITVRVEAYEGDEVTYTGSEEVYIYEAGETVSVDIYLGSGGGGGGGDIYNIDIAGLRNGQRVSERTQIISGVIPESIAPNVDHGRIHLVNQLTGDSGEARLMNVAPGGRFAQEIVLARGENTIWVDFEDANNNVIGRTERITITADIPVMDIKVVLTWDSKTDLDLHVIDPNGEDCYFFHKRTEIGGSLDVDDVDGYGPETFTLENAIPGDYTVEVVAFSLAGQTANATVKVFLEDKLSNVFGPHLFTRTADEWEIPQKIRQ